MADSAGIMSGAFFVGKNELLNWLNEFFKVNYSKVEEAASGAIHCQILDSIWPDGTVPLHKVNFAAKYDYEYINNFKVLQNVFTKQGIKKNVDVERLVKAKYQDNLEFLQWMKHLWDTRYSGAEYDAEKRRADAIKNYGQGHKFSAKPGAEKKTAAPAAAAMKKPGFAKPAPAAAPAAKKPAAAAPAARPAGRPVSAKPDEDAPSGGGRPGSKKTEAKNQDAQVADMNARLSKLRLTIEGLEKERNFYFSKLRDIEVLCQQDEENSMLDKKKVLDILYATDENEDFAPPPAAEEDEAVPDNIDNVDAEDAPAEEDVTF